MSYLPPGTALGALFSGFGLLCMAGCELVAGIENLQLTDTDASISGGAADDSASSFVLASQDATTAGAQGDGSSAHPDAAGDAAAPLDLTAIDVTEGAEAGDAADGGGGGGGAIEVDSTAGGETTDGSEDGSLSDDGGDGALSTELVDNLESDDGHIIPTHGRSGSWFTYNDGTDGGVQTPPAPFLPSPTSPPLGSSQWSAETTGSGFASFAGMGFTLNDPPTGPDAGVRSTYDASAYLGIVFDARVGTGSGTRLRVGFPDANTDASGNSFGQFLTLTTSWTHEIIYFADTAQENSFGTLYPALDAAAIYGIIFQMDATIPPLTFDLWVDNVAFITQ